MKKCCEINKVEPFIPSFLGWTEFTPVIPKMYWDVKSAEQRTKVMCEQLHKLACYAEMLCEKGNLNRADIDELTEQFNKFMESGFNDYYAEQIKAWVNEHMQSIIEQAIKMVFFGLTQDGYFCAWIPNSWTGIMFDTVANYLDENYGCLVLKY